MKKLFVLIAAIPMVLAISCTKPEPDGGGTTSKLENKLVFTAGFDNNFAEVASWENGDRFGVFATGGKAPYANALYKTADSGSEAEFSSDKPVVHIGKAMDLTAIYPYSEAAVAATGKYPLNVPAKYAGVSTIDGTVWAAQVNKLVFKDFGQKVALQFKPVTGVLKLTLSSGEALAPVSKVSATINGGSLACADAKIDVNSLEIALGGGASSTIDWEFASGLNLTLDPVTFYAPILPGNEGKVITFTATLTDNTTIDFGRYTIPTGGISTGEITEIRFKYLQTGQDLATVEPANTYVVSEPATTYCFPINVKGNGKPTTYTWTDDQRAAGTEISISWTEADLRLAPDHVGVLWYASPENDGKCPIDIESLEMNERYAVFTTPEKFVEGNVVIAAYDKEDNIIWSWTIWAVKGWNPDNTGKQIGSYTLMDRNLGAVAGPVDVIVKGRKPELAIGNYYQWGRKDPMPAARTTTSSGWGLPAHTPVASLQRSGKSEDGAPTHNDLIFTTDYNANTHALGTVLGDNYTPEEAVAEAIKYPYKWMSSGTTVDNYDGSAYSWLSHENGDHPTRRPLVKHLWGGVRGMEVQKSIYDPCPPGWTVPTVDALALPIMKAVENPQSNGYYYEEYGFYFPKAGFRHAYAGGGKIFQINNLYMGSASVDCRKPIVSTYDNAMNLSYGSYGDAYQIRCVRKEDINKPVAPNASGPRCALMGDSVTEQWYTPLDDDRGRVEFFTENNFIGKGISGHASGTMLNRFMKDIITLDPQSVSISAGLNDIWSVDKMNRCTYETFTNMCIMASVAYQYCGRVIIASVTPSHIEFYSDPHPELCPRILDINSMLIPFSQRYRFAYADYFSVLRDDEDNLKLELSHNVKDRVHPNRAGYLLMEPVLLKAVKEVFGEK